MSKPQIKTKSHFISNKTEKLTSLGKEKVTGTKAAACRAIIPTLKLKPLNSTTLNWVLLRPLNKTLLWKWNERTKLKLSLVGEVMHIYREGKVSIILNKRAKLWYGTCLVVV